MKVITTVHADRNDPAGQRIVIRIEDGAAKYLYERRNRGAAFDVDLSMLLSDMLDDLIHHAGEKGKVGAS